MPVLHILQKCTQHLLVIDEISPSTTEVTVALQSFRTRTHHLASEQYHLHIYPLLRLPSPQELVSLPISPSRWWSPAMVSGKSPAVRDFPLVKSCQTTTQTNLNWEYWHLIVMTFCLINSKILKLTTVHYLPTFPQRSTPLHS